MANFNKVLKKFREESFSERDKGFRFERLIQAYLKTTTIYASRFQEVWLWNDFPYRQQFGWQDVGIDLVAHTHDGDFWAIQCKCYTADTYINKPEVDSFIATSGRTFTTSDGNVVSFAERLWVSTTNKWNSNAELTIQNQSLPFTRLNLIDLENDEVDWEKLESGLFGKDCRTKQFDIKPHQQKAIDKTHDYLKTHDRGKLIMACGTGKTFTSLKIAEKETDNKGLVLFLVPSIALLGQTLRSWCQQATLPIHAICICSDSQVSKAEQKEDEISTNVVDLALPASTDVDNIVSQLDYLNRIDRKGMTVVFSTYQSIDVISLAQKELLSRTNGTFGTFDLIVCDEAHRTTGVTLKNSKESAFVRVHDNEYIRAEKRIYMTATPRLYTDEIKRKAEDSDAILCSMDDTNYYGEEIYRIGFGEAVEKGLLTDYKVLILAVGDKDITPALRKSITSEDGSIKTEDAPKFVGCINALSKKVLGDEGLIKATDPSPMRRAVAFCSKIEASKETARIFTDCQDDYIKDLSDTDKEGMVDVVAHHVDGKMSATVRDRELMWLKEQPENPMECRMLTNARCLSEGVDVPSLDAVIFVSPKNSQVDVVQSVGRVMRRSEGKKYGYIIIPVIIPEDVEGDEVLEKHANFKVVWTVLNALRAHDDRFNAEVNKIELSKKKPKHIIFGGVAHSDDDSKATGLEEKESAAQEFAKQLSMQFEELQNVFYAKLVTKVGTKRYWELWAKDIAKIAEEHIERIKTLIADEGKHKKAFEQLMRGLRRNINPNLSEQEAVEMLSQHIISQPVFEALFGDYEFTRSNPVSKSMQKMLDLLEDEGKTEEEHEKLQKFYSYVRTTVGDIKDSAGRQRLIVELYDKFFKVASPKTVEKLGIVYTPVEVVDYIIHSIAFIIRKEFDRSLSDENVHILDPFTGTGTFITRLLQSNHIRKEDLLRKYNKEIHANEIVLMAYYIASINIENVFHSMMENEEYNSFEGICLTDTFQLGEEISEENMFSEQFPTNSKRVIAQKKKPITVIIGNPPYSVGQKSANDNAQNQNYKNLNESIAKTYVAKSITTMNKAMYDSYIKAFRWASDRISNKDGGIIGFVTNGSWLDGNTTAGFRLSLEQEFSSIYVFNLRGNQRTSGELSRKEGGKIFGSGSRTPIAITILVKHPNKPINEKAKIYYRDIGDYLSREDKLRIVREMGDINNPNMQWKEITPNNEGDWISYRNEIFSSFLPLDTDKRTKGKEIKSFFSIFSNGVVTNRDSWVYNYSKERVRNNMIAMTDVYNEQREAYHIALQENPKLEIEDFILKDETKIKWVQNLIRDAKNNLSHSFNEEDIVQSAYRPFSRQYLYFNKGMNWSRYLQPKLFPTSQIKNRVICVSGVGANKGFSALITNIVPCLDYLEKGQCFPLYWYDEKEADLLDLFNQGLDNKIDKYTRKDGVTDWILTQCRKQYGYKTPITKEDIFYYVYGILHSPEYRNTFEADLKKMLPRLPLVESKEEFFAFSNAGRQLAELHLNYETIEPYRKCEIEFAPFTNKGDSMNYRVEKMRFGKIDSKTADKSVIYYNTSIAIKNIPSEAYEYVVNGKSAIEWIMERYQVSVDSKSGITNDPNDWAKEHDDEKYIYNLLLRIINVSVQTVEIVKSLPKLKFE